MGPRQPPGRPPMRSVPEKESRIERDGAHFRSGIVGRFCGPDPRLLCSTRSLNRRTISCHVKAHWNLQKEDVTCDNN